MSLTIQVKDELAQTYVATPQELLAEVAGILRYSATISQQINGLLIEAELTHAPSATRLERAIAKLFGHTPETQIIGAGSTKRPARHVLKWTQGAEEIARRTELLGRDGTLVAGLPRTIISGPEENCVAAWRGAFLAHGALSEPGKVSSLNVTAPSPEAALALVGLARRLRLTAKTKESRGSDLVELKDGEGIKDLLQLMGARETLNTWDEQRIQTEVKATSSRLANFDNANLQRSVRAAITASARVERAFEILGDDIQPSLAQAGRLRMAHRQVSLEALGRLASPPETKDAIAGKLRRLNEAADKRAEELGIPDTNSVITEELFTEL